jgi:hypothetical protein
VRALEKLHGTLMLLGRRTRLKGSQVLPSPRPGVLLARIQPEFSAIEFPNHTGGFSSMLVATTAECRTLAMLETVRTRDIRNTSPALRLYCSGGILFLMDNQKQKEQQGQQQHHKEQNQPNRGQDPGQGQHQQPGQGQKEQKHNQQNQPNQPRKEHEQPTR